MFWENFYALCKFNGTTPNAVCKELNLSTAAATHWKNGATPRWSIIKQIADKFEVPPEELLNGDFGKIEGVKKVLDALNKNNKYFSEDSIAIRQKENAPAKFSRSELFYALSLLTEDELDNLLDYAKFLLSKRQAQVEPTNQ